MSLISNFLKSPIEYSTYPWSTRELSHDGPAQWRYNCLRKAGASCTIAGLTYEAACDCLKCKQAQYTRPNGYWRASSGTGTSYHPAEAQSEQYMDKCLARVRMAPGGGGSWKVTIDYEAEDTIGLQGAPSGFAASSTDLDEPCASLDGYATDIADNFHLKIVDACNISNVGAGVLVYFDGNHDYENPSAQYYDTYVYKNGVWYNAGVVSHASYSGSGQLVKMRPHSGAIGYPFKIVGADSYSTAQSNVFILHS